MNLEENLENAKRIISEADGLKRSNSRRLSGSTKRQMVTVMGAILAIGTIVFNMHLIYGALSSVIPISSTGVIASANIRFYRESGCVNNLTSINWGTLYPGASRTVTVYVKNLGTVPLSLDFYLADWNPSTASTYLTLSWDYSGMELQPNQVLSITFTLEVSQSIQGITNFDFNIYVTATEVT